MLPVFGGKWLQRRDGLRVLGPVLVGEPCDRIAGVLAGLGVHDLVQRWFGEHHGCEKRRTPSTPNSVRTEFTRRGRYLAGPLFTTLCNGTRRRGDEPASSGRMPRRDRRRPRSMLARWRIALLALGSWLATGCGPELRRPVEAPVLLPCAHEACLRVLTWNVHAIPLLSPRPPARLRNIARKIREQQPDLVLLQEVWSHAY